MPVVSAESWAARLGLARTALFGFESQPFGGHHSVLLNGIKGSFLLSAVEDEQPTSTYRDWAWSANVRHHVAIQGHSVVVTAPTKNKKERFELSQVERVLDRFFRYLEADDSTPSVSVVDHFVRLFRSHQAASDAEIGCEVPRLASFLTLLAAHMFPREAAQQDAFYRRVGLDVSIGSTIREQYATRFREELQTNPITQLSLSLPIAIRHAGGALFQETHAEVSSANQMTLFGLPAAHRKSLILTSGAYYTPPGLARAVAELTIQPHLARSEITLLDPACGSGLFLCEAIRALQREGYEGAIRVYGFDIDEAAVQMAKFSLGCAFTDWPERFQFEIRQEDFLRLGRLPAANIVVMNPPFRKWEMFQPEEKDAIMESLGDLYKGRPDLAMVFVSKALGNLANDGTLGTLLPLGILSSESALKWRQSLLEQGNLRFISSLGDHSPFSNAIVSVTAMILDRGENDPNRQISLLWSSERPNTRRIDNDVNVPEVALDIAAASQGCLACSFYEQWKPLGNRHVVFKQASLRFFWIYEDQGPQHVQVFRLEWVGAEKKPKSSEEEQDSYTFQGEYAAHPHWHFDRFAQYETRAQLLAELQGVDDVVTVDLEEISEDQLERLTAPERPRALDLRWFPKIHFPALAGWNRGGAWDAGCDNVPHQCIPDSPQQIESWVYSALCYIRYEMAKHL